jgi:phage gpG-like protein
MITATYKLNWQGEPYKRRLLRELQRATRQGAERVRRNAKETQLNVSGQAVTNKYGANKGTVQERFANPNITNFQTVKGKKKLMIFGGTFTFQGKSGRNRKRTYSIDRVYWYGKPLFRWVQSSQPGTPPHKQTGTLQRSIAVEVASHGLKAKVGPGQKLKYARIQELGGKGLINLPPRPYMRPALLAELQRIMFGYEMAVARASK